MLQKTLALLCFALWTNANAQHTTTAIAGMSYAGILYPTWQHGTCWLYPQLYQFCSDGELVTQLIIPAIDDNAHMTIMRPSNGNPITMTDRPFTIEPAAGKLDKPFEISWYPEVGREPKRGKLVYSYGGGHCSWWSDEEKKCGGCGAWGDWSGGPLDCAKAGNADSRTSAMTCYFTC